MRIADTQPSLLLEGHTPQLLDEWQMAPVLWDAVRFAVDDRAKPGQFILTGSTLPLNHEIMHSGRSAYLEPCLAIKNNDKNFTHPTFC